MFIIAANQTWISLGNLILGALIGAAISFFLTKRMFEKQLKENPPIDEKTVRAMMMQMGRKPSEAQVRQIMRSLGQK